MITIPAALIAALITVESSGNDYAIGDHGKAVGCLQIHEVVVIDLHARSSYPCTLADRLDRKKSIEMCVLYLNIYCTEKRLGRKPAIEDMARIWNGGPNGFKPTHRGDTQAYWDKVKKQLLTDAAEPKWNGAIYLTEIEGFKLTSPR